MKLLKMALMALLIACVVHADPLHSSGFSALEIAKKSQDAMNMAKDSRADMEMAIFDASGSKRERRLVSYAKRYPDGSRKALIVFEYPADVRGTSFLVFSAKGTDSQQWLWLPALGRIRQVSSSDQSGSFMGSDFSFYDMGIRDADDFSYTLLKEEPSDGVQCYVIESVPKRKSAYGKTVSWIRKDNFIPVRIDIYDAKGTFIKRGFSSRIETVSGIPSPTHIEMRQASSARYTAIELKNIRYDSGLSDDIFTQRYMMRGR